MAMVVKSTPPSFAPDNAPECAAASIPSASPETTHSPLLTKLCAKACADFSPGLVGLRLPTMLTLAGQPLASNKSIRPKSHSTSGGSGRFSNALGYSASPSVTMRRLAVSAASQLAHSSICLSNSSGADCSACAWRSVTKCMSDERGCSKIAGGRPKAASSFCAEALPTPSVSIRRSHAASSSLPI